MIQHNQDTQARISIKSVDLIVYDFDGVMTDNRVIVFEDGREAVVANRADGLGVSMIRKMGILQLILSTETNRVVRARAEKLSLEVIHGCKDKKSALLTYCQDRNIQPSRVIFVGNDLNDLEVMMWVGYPIAPLDAHPMVREIAFLVTGVPGGAGVVRELAESILLEEQFTLEKEGT